MAEAHTVIVGAGIGGLVAAVCLAAKGVRVTVCERAPSSGGKLRQVVVGARALDAGPTVFTLKSVFEDIFAECGTSLADHLTLRPAITLARHTWTGGECFDLFADPRQTVDAIGQLAGAGDAARFEDFTRRARHIFSTLEHSFIKAAAPSPWHLVREAGLSGLGDLARISPFTTMWDALGSHFRDQRLRQLFGRYATYCGSSPFLAPATLMLVAHVEQAGVWYVEGGMYRIVQAFEALARKLGVEFRHDSEVQEVLLQHGRTAGVGLTTGERIAARSVVLNADIAAVGLGLFGSAIRGSVTPVRPAGRSLSATTWNMVAHARGFPLARHTVFFSGDSAAEFDDLFARRVTPRDPTVYICAEDRDDAAPLPGTKERLLCLINSPPGGDAAPDPLEISRCLKRTMRNLARCGLDLEYAPEEIVTTTPRDFARMFPGTGGALYGQASHGWRASFQRTGSRSRIPGLYFAGGSIHPGPGVPMAALSGQQAAKLLLADLDSMSLSPRAAMHGGTSMA